MAINKKKAKVKDSTGQGRDNQSKNNKRKVFRDNKERIGKEKKRMRRGPRLPNAFQNELDKRDKERGHSDTDEDVAIDDTVGSDLYEYEEAIPEEELRKNKRFDPVKDYQYELPEDFEDENVSSDEGEDAEAEDDYRDDDDSDADGRHLKMLQEITGLPGDAFAGKKKKDVLIPEVYPESEYNPSRDVLDGDGRISIQDLVDPLQGKSGFSKLRKSLRRIENKSTPIIAPLAKPYQERLERKAAYEQSKKDITKWEPLVKKNRENPTLYFGKDVNLGFSTIGSIASEFVPRTDFEKKIASLVNHNEVVEAHKKDGARLLEMNEISVQDLEKQQDRLAKMRNLLFRHEVKAKRIKKIKSKAYHRLLKKDRRKGAEDSIQMDPEVARELAMKQEFKRAEERMTLKHKNSSKWAKRILKRGMKVQDDATRAAFAEQLNTHAALTRKMNSLKESSSSDESNDEDDSDDMSVGSDQEKKSNFFMKAKEKICKVLEEDEELPKSGVLSLPFMVRGLKKRKEAADEEANLALKEYDLALKQLEDNKQESGTKAQNVSSGRKVFGTPRESDPSTSKNMEQDNYYGNSDSENDTEKKDDIIEHEKSNHSLRELDIDPGILREEFATQYDSGFKSFEDTIGNNQETTYDVAFLSCDSWKKVSRSMGSKPVEGSEVSNDDNGKSSATVGPPKHDPDVEENDGYSDSDSGGEMVDGIFSGGDKSTYELPSQAELIQRAFAGDNVEEDFEKDKEEVLNEENPQPENPVLLPGWGQWTDVQKKKGLPSWMVKEHEAAKMKREEALKKRKDAHLKHVIISERRDKKAEKLHTKSLPYPYTSKEVFEQSIRMPIGPEFNPVSALGSLNRPEVVKKAGVIINPIEFKEVNTGERAVINKCRDQKQRKGKDKKQRLKRIPLKV